MLTVYPRLCGGTHIGDRLRIDVDGLSPPVRGNLGVWGGGGGGFRSIPACAGEPPLIGKPVAGDMVYPRLCGGTHANPHAHANPHGLSPPVRGNPICAHIRRRPRRSIPACAGEPWRQKQRRTPLPVYPRLCGGTLVHWAKEQGLKGLSPPVRGNLPLPLLLPLSSRSIPACAGEPAGYGDP